jgi:hypothetical protein
MWRLFYPLRYFYLVNDEKRHVDLWPTIILAIIMATPFVFVQDTSFFKANGFLDKTLTLTAALTGFYIAALVAAATFTNAALDKVIKSGAIALITKDADGRRVKDFLTRREFVCMIFGYLAFASLAISLIAIFFIGISTANRGILEHWNLVVSYFQKDIGVIRGRS